MAKRLVNTSFCSSLGWNYRIELISAAETSIDLDYQVHISEPGFELNYQSGVDEVKRPIITSSLTLDMHVPCEYRLPIVEAVYEYPEFNLICNLYIDDSLYWSGIVHSEEFVETINDGTIIMSFTASDGIAQLKHMDFKTPDGLIWNTWKSTAEWILECLKKLPNYQYSHPSPGFAPVFTERMLPRINNNGGSMTDDESLLNQARLHGRGFYFRGPRAQEEVVGFVRKLMPLSETFQSTYDVLEDILAALGASMCYANGCWQIFDRTSQFDASFDNLKRLDWYYDNTDLFTTPVNSEQVIDLDSYDFYFSGGATRQGAYPFYRVVQMHEQADSDILIGAGISYDPRMNWERRITTVDMGMGYNMGLGGIILALSGNYLEPWPSSSLPWMQTDEEKERYTVNQIVVPSGDDGGQLKVKFGGQANYTKKDNEGCLLILGLRMEVSDGTNTWRLRRLVRTIKTTSSGENYGVDIIGEIYDYLPKFYEPYTWVRDDDPNYEHGFLEVMIGADPTVLQSGITDRFLQTDYPTTPFFTPPRTKVDNNDNVLKKTTEDERRFFVWRFEEVIDMPDQTHNGGLPIDEISSVKFSSPFLANSGALGQYREYYDTDGNLNTDLDITPGYSGDLGGNATLFTWRTAIDGYDSGLSLGTDPINNPYQPLGVSGFSVVGFECRLGDGASDYNNLAIFTPEEQNGYEQLQLTSTTLGSGYQNVLANIKGRFYQWLYDLPGLEYGVLEDSIRWHAYEFDDVNDEYSLRLGHYVCKSAMQIRGVTRQVVRGSLFKRGTDVAPVIGMHDILLTGNLDPNSDEYFIPYELTITPESYRLGLLRRNVNRVVFQGEQSDGKFSKGPNQVGGNGDGDTGGIIDSLYSSQQQLQEAVNEIQTGDSDTGLGTLFHYIMFRKG